MDVDNTSTTLATNTVVNQALVDKILDAINADEVNRLIPSIVYTSLMLLIGLPGNCLVLYIYYFKWKRCNAKYFIFTMALFDCVNCTIGLPTEIVILLNIYKFDNPAVCKLSRFTTFTMNGASAIILLIVAIDRYIRICRPTSKPMSNTLAIRLCIFSAIFATFSNCSSLVFYGTFKLKKIIHGTVVVIKICLIDNDMVSHVLGFYIWIFIGFFAIAIAVTLLYIFIGLEVWKRRHLPTGLPPIEQPMKRKLTITSDDSSDGPVGPRMQKGSIKAGSPRIGSVKQSTMKRRMSRSNIRIGKSTFTLFLITVIYYLSYMPYLVLALIRTADPTFGNNFTAGEDRAYHLFLRSYLLSSAINPIVYSFFNSEFRKKAKDVFRPCLP